MKILNYKINIMQNGKTPKQGVLIFVAGHSAYGKMAAALAATIKVQEETIPIAILHHGAALSSLSEKEKGLFYQMIPLDDTYVYNKDGSFNPIKARLHLYELTPFQETLCIDADNAWLNRKKPSEVFAEMADVPFTIQNAGYTKCDSKAEQYYSVWAEIQDVIKGYEIEGKKFYRTYGEWMYFKKDPIAKKFFQTARKIFLSKPKAGILGFIGQQVPDELAFSLAMAQTEIYPHKEMYLPTTYYHINSKGQQRFSQPYQLAETYYTISMGGSSNPEYSIRNYNLLVSAAYRKLGFQSPYQWKQKRNFLVERKTA